MRRKILLEAITDRAVEQVKLTLEMGVEGRAVDRRAVGDLLHGDVAETPLHHQGHERLLEQLARALDTRVVEVDLRRHERAPAGFPTFRRFCRLTNNHEILWVATDLSVR